MLPTNKMLLWIAMCTKGKTLHCVRSGFPNGTNGIPISFKVLPMVPLVIPFVPMVIPMVPLALPMERLVPLVSQWYHWLPMVPLVKLSMVPLGEPRTEPLKLTSYVHYKVFIKGYTSCIQTGSEHWYFTIDIGMAVDPLPQGNLATMIS